GGYDTILYTLNGNNFQKASYLSIPAGNPGFTDLYYSSENICYAVSGRYVWKSYNGGVYFDTLFSFNEYASQRNSIHFLNDQIGWLSNDGTIFKTTDGGLNWNRISSVGSYGGLLFLNADVGF